MSVFEAIYKDNSWGFGSGHGSLPKVTKGYRAYIENFIKENHIKTVVDYGCGDWQFSKLIDWGDAKYIGLDIVPSVINTNKRVYGTNNIKFRLIKPMSSELPKGDLLIVKDVVQHWPTPDVKKFLETIAPQYKFALVTNCSIPEKDVNANIAMGDFRPLDILRDPFSSNGAVVYSFDGPKSFSFQTRKMFPAWRKNVVLLTS
jgi:hypothetical protein